MDLIITGKTFHDHLNNQREVLSRFRHFDLKLKPTKCNLFKDEIGSCCKRGRVHVNPSLVQDVEMWLVPQNLKELKAFLGLTNYYRRFYEGFC